MLKHANLSVGIFVPSGRGGCQAFCANRSTDDLVCKLSFKNPLYVQSTDSCTDVDATGARELIRTAAIAAIECDENMMLRCAISYHEFILGAEGADSNESQATTNFVKIQCEKMHLEFSAETLARFGSVRSNDALRTIAASQYTPVAFVE